MECQELIDEALVFLEHCADNFVSEEDAIRSDLAGMRIFDAPIFGVAAANDPIFEKFLEPEVIGPEFLLPEKWLSEAQSAVSFFLPFTVQVKMSNRQRYDKPSDEWLHARIEGQLMVNKLADHMVEWMQSKGFLAVAPSSDSRFRRTSLFSSNWSERHVAYACGLGTFGLSRGLITKKGIAGRFGSFVTSASLPASEREYDTPFSYCTMCGLCQRNCPADAIDIKRGIIDGKDQKICQAFVSSTLLPPHGPHKRERFGCGKCQIAVPCESQIPTKKK